MKIAVVGATGRVGEHVVDVLREQGVQTVEIARSLGVDVVTGEGLSEALDGVTCIIDCATGASPDGAEAAAFFEAATRNLVAARVPRAVVVSIIGIDTFNSGYNGAKLVHERAWLESGLDVRVLRAAQFHEFVETMLAWGRQGDVARVPPMRTQLVAARAVAESLVYLALTDEVEGGPIWEIAGPREERLVEVARLVAPEGVRVEEGGTLGDADSALYESGALLPGPDARLAGPAFTEWLATVA
ncbi:SDR family oxidoreductase [Solirubrobacter soli]|uniref:SDR family oxidoreductase n=1 Tax=Solirubrobacter soli TaxID=363832 RepID=UPI0003F5FD8C|nr:sugar nucleotide-binding protein [Solirubrobacter soli]